LLSAKPGEVMPETGPLSADVSLDAYAGQQIRISFVWDIPEYFTGPALAQLDNVRITAKPATSVPTLPIFGLLTPGGLLGLFGTTKGEDKGTGLGLSFSKKTLTEMGGELDLMNTSNGARVVLTIPKATQPNETADPNAALASYSWERAPPT
jgi:hypothetical protein